MDDITPTADERAALYRVLDAYNHAPPGHARPALERAILAELRLAAEGQPIAADEGRAIERLEHAYLGHERPDPEAEVFEEPFRLALGRELRAWRHMGEIEGRSARIVEQPLDGGVAEACRALAKTIASIVPPTGAYDLEGHVGVQLMALMAAQARTFRRLLAEVRRLRAELASIGAPPRRLVMDLDRLESIAFPDKHARIHEIARRMVPMIVDHGPAMREHLSGCPHLACEECAAGVEDYDDSPTCNVRPNAPGCDCGAWEVNTFYLDAVELVSLLTDAPVRARREVVPSPPSAPHDPPAGNPAPAGEQADVAPAPPQEGRGGNLAGGGDGADEYPAVPARLLR